MEQDTKTNGSVDKAMEAVRELLLPYVPYIDAVWTLRKKVGEEDALLVIMEALREREVDEVPSNGDMYLVAMVAGYLAWRSSPNR